MKANPMDIVERLRLSANFMPMSDSTANLAHDAANTIEEQADEIERLRTDYANACKVVSDMHAAAVGAKVGPVVGVIEDVMVLRAERDGSRKEIERLRLDAARYRWLRDNPDSGLIALKLHVYPKEFYAGPALDAAIDAAMKG